MVTFVKYMSTRLLTKGGNMFATFKALGEAFVIAFKASIFVAMAGSVAVILFAHTLFGLAWLSSSNIYFVKGLSLVTFFGTFAGAFLSRLANIRAGEAAEKAARRASTETKGAEEVHTFKETVNASATSSS